jgi:peptide/nickel transport system ATP-binding protein
MTTLLEARTVTKTYGSGLLDRQPTVALADFSLTIDSDRPSIIAVVGESGSGKTTLARLLLGLTSPTSGHVLYQGHDLARLPTDKRQGFRTDVQAIFQDPYGVYNPFYRVDHVLTTPVAKFHLARSKAAANTLIEDALRTVGLRPDEILGRFPHQLSGGQRQRIMVARALLLNPRLIIADEPVSMVDASLRATILGSLQRLRDERGISIIYITHDLATAYQVSDSIIVLYRASIAEAGDVQQVVRSPRHPYTQLLVGSIPQVSITRGWADQETAPAAAPAGVGCRFAPRCPQVRERCRVTQPPLYQVDENRAASCFLYADAALLSAERLGTILTAENPTA